MHEVGSFFLVDVFGTEPFSGNPLAVVLGAMEFTREQMQNITRWLNYSETTFVYPVGSATAFEVRAFFTDHQGIIREDPVTGSLNASLVQWLFSTGRAAGHYVARQGTFLGRRGRIDVTQDAAGQVWVGGKTSTMFRGQFATPVTSSLLAGKAGS